MLDFITIRLDYYRELFQMLYKIYMQVNVVSERGTLCMMPTSKFIIRACLGWLFEHPDIPEDYYNLNNAKITGDEDVGTVDTARDDHQLNPHLEGVLNAACPFLADFRVSVMPQRMTKSVSRTGRYRHITTKFQDKTIVQKTRVQDSKERLIEAFLASQTISVRRIVEFTIDRVTSAVVKDFQVKNLLPIRKDAKSDVETLSGQKSLEDVVKKMIEIFQDRLKLLKQQWTDEAHKNAQSRIQQTLDALLPIETLSDVKKTLFNITFERTCQKLEEWRSSNMSTIEIFSKDIQTDAMKIRENQQQNGAKRSASNIIIDLSTDNMPSEFFKDFQHLLHKTSRHADEVTIEVLENCVRTAGDILDKQVLPSNAYRNIAFYILQLMLLLTANRPDLMDDSSKHLTAQVFQLWRHEKLSTFISFSTRDEAQPQQRLKVENFIFSKVISARLMISMQEKSRLSLETYGNFLAQLVDEKFITVEHINEQSVQLYKHEWSQDSLDDISFLMNHIKTKLLSIKTQSPSSSESQLFMELVADLARDMENF